MSLDYHYWYTTAELEKDWDYLRDVKVFKKGSQFRPGIKLCQHFCPNFFDIENEKGISFAKSWNTYEVMDKVREWGLNSMSKLWMSWIRRAVYMASGLPNSSFYRPHFSKQVIGMTGKPKGTLFDPCFGWGGRLLGTVAQGWDYIGCDPNKETYTNVTNMLTFIQDQGKVSNVDLKNIQAEDYNYKDSTKVDVVLTSPPYYNLEMYTGEGTQAYNKFTSYQGWVEGWLFPLIENCLSIIEDGGISAWNAMNFKKNNLADDVIRKHEELGWELVDTVGFSSPLANIRNIKNKDMTYIFKKTREC